MSAAASKAVTVVVGRFEPLLGYGLKFALSDDPYVRVLVAGLEDAELESLVLTKAPRVAIVGQAVGYAVLLRLKAVRPAMGVIVVVSDPGRLLGEMLVELGVTCLAQNAARCDILTAVRLAAHGKPTYLPIGGDQAARIATDVSSLTEREIEVFVRLSEGRTNREIANALHISVDTVATHVSKIFRKLGVRKRQELLEMRVPDSKK